MEASSIAVDRGQCPVGPGEDLEFDLHYVTTIAQLNACVAWCRTQRAIALDIETDGMTIDGLDWWSKKIATIQVGNPTGDSPVAWVICVRSIEALKADGLQPLLKVLEDPKIMKIGQNITFEILFLSHKYGIKIRNVADCQVAELVLRAGLFELKKERSEEGGASRKPYTETSMAKLCKRYLHIDIDKSPDIRMTFWSVPPGQLTHRHLVYAAGDVIYPFYLAAAQKPEIASRGLRRVIEIEFGLIPILAEGELYGVGIDQDAWRQLWQDAIVQRVTAKQQLDDLFRDQSDQAEMFDTVVAEVASLDTTTERSTIRVRPTQGSKEINYDAPKQVQQAIKTYCERINWPVRVITTWPELKKVKAEYGQEWLERRTDKTVSDVPDYLIPESKYVILLQLESDILRLAKIRRQLPANLVDTYLSYKEAAKRSGTYGIEFLNKHVKQDGRVHSHFHQVLAATGRISSEPNTQNLPRLAAYRRCFQPKPGYKFVIADYSQIEPRLSAETSQDPVYVKAFQDRADIYLRVAEAMLGEQAQYGPNGKLTPEWKLRRQIFKVIVLMLAYRGGPGKLRDRLTLALEEYIAAGEVELPTYEYARELHAKFFDVHMGIRTYQESCAAAADLHAPTRPKLADHYIGDGVTYIAGPCGRKRFFGPESATKVYTEAPNAPIQGTSATITKNAMVLIQESIDTMEWDAHMVLNVHDELVYEVREDHADAFAPVMKQLMEDAGRQYIKHVPVIAEFPEGTNGIVGCWLKEAA